MPSEPKSIPSYTEEKIRYDGSRPPEIEAVEQCCHRNLTGEIILDVSCLGRLQVSLYMTTKRQRSLISRYPALLRRDFPFHGQPHDTKM